MYKRQYKLQAAFGPEGVLGSGREAGAAPEAVEDPPLRLLERLSDIPLVRRPFGAVADMLGTSEGWVIGKVGELMRSGAIRRFGAVLDHTKAGLSENALVLWRAEDPDGLGVKFAGLAWVSHCYRRRTYPDFDYQVYTMVHARSREELEDRIGRMRDIAGTEPLVLYTKRRFKKSSFEVRGEDDPAF